MPVTLLIPLMTSLGRAVADQFISNDEYLKWVKVAFDVFDSASEVDTRLKDLEGRLAARLDSGQHFDEADFDAIVAEIAGRDQAWADV